MAQLPEHVNINITANVDYQLAFVNALVDYQLASAKHAYEEARKFYDTCARLGVPGAAEALADTDTLVERDTDGKAVNLAPLVGVRLPVNRDRRDASDDVDDERGRCFWGCPDGCCPDGR